MKFWLELTIVFLLLVIDQGLKFVISILDFSYTFKLISIGIWHNSDAAFSISFPYYITIVMSLIAIIGLLYGWYYYSYVKVVKSFVFRMGLLLLIAGGVSNVLDRVHSSAVIDFIYIDVLNVHLNIADLYILLGSATVLFFLYLLSGKEITPNKLSGRQNQ